MDAHGTTAALDPICGPTLDDDGMQLIARCSVVLRYDI